MKHWTVGLYCTGGLWLLAIVLLGTQLVEAVPPPRTGEVAYEPAAQEEIVPEHFRVEPHTFTFEQTFVPTVSKVIEISEVTFPSPVQTEYENNNTVHAEYFRPLETTGPVPGVVVLHILGGDFDLSRLVARHLAYNGVAALFVKLPHYGPRATPGSGVEMISPDIDNTVASMTQAVQDIRVAGQWLAAQPEVDENQLGITGISLGGITSALASTAEPRFKKIGLMLAGGDFPKMAWESTLVEDIREQWIAAGGDLESLREAMRPVDPITHAANVQGRQILMLNAKNDDVVPPACTEALWEAFGQPEIVWWSADHYSVGRFIFDAVAALTRFFQPGEDATSAAEAADEQPRLEQAEPAEVIEEVEEVELELEPIGAEG